MAFILISVTIAGGLMALVIVAFLYALHRRDGRNGPRW